jgi:hypothetical protein
MNLDVPVEVEPPSPQTSITFAAALFSTYDLPWTGRAIETPDNSPDKIHTGLVPANHCSKRHLRDLRRRN